MKFQRTMTPRDRMKDLSRRIKGVERVHKKKGPDTRVA